MHYTIRLEPSGIVFAAARNCTILDAALGAGIGISNSCRRGNCRACRAHVVSGQWCANAFAENESEETILLCSSYAVSDLRLRVDALPPGASSVLVRSFPARVEELSRLADDVMQMRLCLPRGAHLQAAPGQYVEISGEDGRRHAFSLAKAIDADMAPLIELHVRRKPGGRFTSFVFDTCRPGTLLKLHAPYGNFGSTFRPEAPTIFIAGGTGFAPIKSVLERAFERECVNETYLYWGARTADGLYMRELCREWQTLHEGFWFVPVISDAGGADKSERNGFVHQAVLDDFASLENFSVFACGSPEMIESARQTLTQSRGLPSERFFANSFDLPFPVAVVA